MRYVEIPILEAAEMCGIPFDLGSNREEIRTNCPFCGDTKKHMYMNTVRNVFFCHRCGEHGNSVTLYAKQMGKSNLEAYRALTSGGSNLFSSYVKINHQVKNSKNLDISSLEIRDMVYNTMLNMLELYPKHERNLLNRGLSLKTIRENKYKSVPPKYSKEYREVMFTLSDKYDLNGIPGYYKSENQWHMYAPNGFFIPVKEQSGKIQALQIRLDNEYKGKYRWFSSSGYADGVPCRSFIHCINFDPAKPVYITEGALKADIASFLLGGEASLLAVAGVNNLSGLQAIISNMGISEVNEAFDMDKHTNPFVKIAAEKLKAITADMNIDYKQMNWDPKYKGIDDMALASAASSIKVKAA